MMQSLRVSPDVIDRCQNHTRPGSKVRRHYLHYDYADEKREAWRLLGVRFRTNRRDQDERPLFSLFKTVGHDRRNGLAAYVEHEGLKFSCAEVLEHGIEGFFPLAGDREDGRAGVLALQGVTQHGAWLRLFAEAKGPIKGTPNSLAAAADASHDASPMQLMIATAFICVTSSRMLRESLAGRFSRKRLSLDAASELKMH